MNGEMGMRWGAVTLCCVALVAATVPPRAGWAGDERTIIELVGATMTPSFDDEAAWGWWNPAKYGAWQADDDVSFDLAELRLMVPGGEYGVFVGVELYPELAGGGVHNDEDGSLLAEHALSVDMEVYDLALSQSLELAAGDSLRPWIGLTYMSIDERRSWVSHSELPQDRASSRLWGAAAGFDGELALSGAFKLTGRVVGRWARGDRDSTFTAELAYGVPDTTQVSATDRVERIMWGGEAGVLWQAYEGFEIDLGWRYRDWRHDDGPASFGGPFLRLRLSL